MKGDFEMALKRTSQWKDTIGSGEMQIWGSDVCLSAYLQLSWMTVPLQNYLEAAKRKAPMEIKQVELFIIFWRC